MTDIINRAKAARPVAYRYRYKDPLTGTLVWRRTGECWNGQRPHETEPLYSEQTVRDLVAEVERLREDARWSYINGAMDGHKEGVIDMQVILSRIAADLRDNGYFVPPVVLSRAWEAAASAAINNNGD